MMADLPSSYAQSQSSPDRGEWDGAMRSELETLAERGVYELVPRPKGKVIGSRWVYSHKRNREGVIERYKARLVAQGYTQRFGLDYDLSFSPVVNFSLVRLFYFSFCVCAGWLSAQFDVKCAYLYGDLSHTTYLEQPEGFADCPTTHVWLLRKALYGLHQSGLEWFRKLHATLIDLGYERCKWCNCVYFLGDELIVLVYVDDLAVFGQCQASLDRCTSQIASKFSIKFLGTVANFLGVSIDTLDSGLHVFHQMPYIRSLVEKFGPTACPRRVPVPQGTVVTRADGSEISLPYPYRSLVGSLLYLALRTRPDILFSIVTLSQFNSCYGETHWHLLMGVLSYIESTAGLRVAYHRVTCPRLVCYTDASFASCVDTSRSTGGYVILLGDCPVAWACRKQTVVATSSMYSEYIALFELVVELQWLVPIFQFICGILNWEFTRPLVFCDSGSAISFVQNAIERSRTKSLGVTYHAVRESYEQGLFELKYVRTGDNVADIFTKFLSVPIFQRHSSSLLNSPGV